MIAVTDLPRALTVGLSEADLILLAEGLERMRVDPVAAAVALRGWQPHASQAEVLRALDVRRGRVKLALVNAGTGWGKTDLISELHAEASEAKPGAQCLMASRSQEQANLALKRLVMGLSTNPVSAKTIDHVAASPFPTLYRKNGSFITARTTKDDCVGLRGPEWDFVTLDEAAFGDEFAWHFLTTRVRKSNGPVFGFSSPEEEWFEDLYHEFDDAHRDGDETVYAHTGPATENPHLSSEFFERMKARLPEVLYRQEVLAEFVGSNVHTFRREHLLKIFDAALPPSVPPVEGHRYGLGFDLGVEASAAVGIVLDTTSPELVIGVHAESHANTTWPHVQRRVEEIVRAYPGRKALDYTGVGRSTVQNLRVHVREEEKFVFTGPSRYELCVEAMKFIEEMADRPAGLCSLILPSTGAWAPLREQMRKHKLSTAKRRDSKSLDKKAGLTWDELDAFLLAVHAARVSLSRRGPLAEAA